MSLCLRVLCFIALLTTVPGVRAEAPKPPKDFDLGAIDASPVRAVLRKL